jgi:outer membrane protein OmpA-like peptidoglycan-associated protein
MRIVVITALLLTLTGCTANLAQLKELAPNSDNFQSALAAEYLAYSESEAEQGRAHSSEHFAGKGLDSMHGEMVLPDETSNAKLIEPRAELMAALSDDVKHVAAQKAARAQMLFDCWNEQVNSKLSPVCADEFNNAFEEIQSVADSFIHGEAAHHVVVFEASSSTMDAAADGVVAEVAAHVKKLGKYRIQLDAHPKNPDDNALADARLDALQAALVKAGVSAGRIKTARGNEGKVVVLSSAIDEQSADAVDITIKSTNRKTKGK